MLTDIYAEEVKKLSEEMKDIDLKDREDVQKFIKNLTELIYNHKMIGLVYDYYKEDVEVLKEDKLRLKGVEEVVNNMIELQAAFPDLTVNIENTIISGSSEEGFKAYRRMKYRGTNTGYSKYGGPTGKKIGNDCLGMTIFYVNKVNGQWKITSEIDMKTVSCIKKAMTL